MTPELTTSALKMKTSALKTIITAGIVAGILDGIAACLSVYIASGKGPEVVWKFVASGVFGTSAFGGGASMVVAGIIFHMLIAMTWAIIFYFVYPTLKNVLKNTIVIGIVYGALVWIAMNLVVVPLSNTPQMPSTISGIIKGMAILMVCIGLPLSIIIGKYYDNVKSAD
jgi:hypothetical protein